jgi:hypothetical protein
MEGGEIKKIDGREGRELYILQKCQKVITSTVDICRTDYKPSSWSGLTGSNCGVPFIMMAFDMGWQPSYSITIIFPCPRPDYISV